jgi:hypothetical protein
MEESKLFSYTAMRLRQIGEDLEKIKIVKVRLFRVKSDVSLFHCNDSSSLVQNVRLEGMSLAVSLETLTITWV